MMYRRSFVLSNVIARLSISRFVQKIFVIKSQSRRKTDQMSKYSPPQFFWERRPKLFYGRLFARFTVCRLAKLGLVPFADLRLRNLAMKSRMQNLRKVGAISGPMLYRLRTKVHEILGQYRNPLYLPMPLPDCLCHVSFRR